MLDEFVTGLVLVHDAMLVRYRDLHESRSRHAMRHQHLKEELNDYEGHVDEGGSGRCVLDASNGRQKLVLASSRSFFMQHHVC